MKENLYNIQIKVSKKHLFQMQMLDVIILTVFILITFISSAHADCFNYVSSQTINYGTVVIQRDTPAGTAVSGILRGPQQTVAVCADPSGTGVVNGMNSTLSVSSSYNGNTVFKTPLDGVGIEIGINGGFYAGQWNDFILRGNTYGSWGVAIGSSGNWSWVYQPQIQFIKTSNIAQAGVFSQQIAYYRPAYGTTNYPYGNNNSGLIPVYVTGNVVVLACAITTPNLTFPIGDVLASSFGSSIGTIPSGAQNTQNLGLNCDAGANINIQLAGTQNPDVATTSVLALTNQGNADVAKGVGVQLLYNGSPLVLNNRIMLKQSSGGQESFPITARYYQTKTAVTTGKANASATLNLTYQ